MLKPLLLVLALAAALPARAAGDGMNFYGYAYDLKSQKYLYTEVHHHQMDNGRWLSGTITYYTPAGVEMGRKTLDFRNDRFVPVFRLEQRYGYAEGVTDSGDPVQMFFRTAADKPAKTGTTRKTDDMASDSGFHSYVRAHFAELMKGQPVSMHLAVAGELDNYHFRLQRGPDTQFEGRTVVNIIAEPDSLLRYLVPALTLTYDAATQQLVEYRGRSNIHDPVTGKPYDVHIAYYSLPPPDVPKLPPMN